MYFEGDTNMFKYIIGCSLSLPAALGLERAMPWTTLGARGVMTHQPASAIFEEDNIFGTIQHTSGVPGWLLDRFGRRLRGAGHSMLSLKIFYD